MIIILLITPFHSFSNNDYLKIMEETIAKMYAFESIDAYKAVANQFEVIAKAEEEKWLPRYYHANCFIILFYVDATADYEQKKNYLTTASNSLDILLKKFPNESEIEVLSAFLSVSYMVLDPANAPNILPKYNAAIAKALELESSNPRARFFQLASEIGKAQFFGQSTDQFCPDLKKLLEEWDLYEPKSTIHPKWGKDDIPKKIKECGCD